MLIIINYEFKIKINCDWTLKKGVKGYDSFMPDLFWNFVNKELAFNDTWLRKNVPYRHISPAECRTKTLVINKFDNRATPRSNQNNCIGLVLKLNSPFYEWKPVLLTPLLKAWHNRAKIMKKCLWHCFLIFWIY